ncbi:MarR family winged helix-turn-helix transcriptional regulator [Sandarakinorhabdus oryzae]|uniref:MarR family winged helix-turn-helix transcriptional regulator n=1 Tax=Sandarakinorhabdus oryzae TaxID=2675220 RepID=UPI0012E28E1D|nr:MarR family winged helix-turn-helix transcriptional regulator [Sandarakinorhabdus oryzae]
MKAELLTVNLSESADNAGSVRNVRPFAGPGAGASIVSMGAPAINPASEVPDTAMKAPMRVRSGKRAAAPLTETGKRLASLAAVAESLSQALALLAGEDQAEDERPVTAETVHRLISLRRDRDTLFPPGLFSDPAWDILLALVAARLEGVSMSVSSLCLAAAVPPTTGLRWISSLIEQGLLVRQPDPNDGRRIYIVLAEPAFQTMLTWLQRLTVA